MIWQRRNISTTQHRPIPLGLKEVATRSPHLEVSLAYYAAPFSFSFFSFLMQCQSDIVFNACLRTSFETNTTLPLCSGRSDQPEDPYRPHGGAFEVDGTSAAPIELPAVSASYPSSVALRVPRLNPIQENASTDPHANLNSIRTDSGKPAHVNHWNQWKSIGGD